MPIPKSKAGPAEGADSAPPQDQGATDEFIDFKELQRRIPLCERTLRERVRRKVIPSIVLGRKRIFSWFAVKRALHRLQVGADADAA